MEPSDDFESFEEEVVVEAAPADYDYERDKRVVEYSWIKDRVVGKKWDGWFLDLRSPGGRPRGLWRLPQKLAKKAGRQCAPIF